MRKFFNLFFLICSSTLLHAQIDQTVKFHYVKATNKQISMVGYEIGTHRITYNICGGVGNGTDNHSISPDNIGDEKEIRKIRSSQVVYPSHSVPDTYLQSCDSKYSVKQVRIGFTVFCRRNDTLGRHPFTGPHFGIEAMYTSVYEQQTVVYASTTPGIYRFTFSGTNKFAAIGAGTHVGWQFCFYKDHIYLDLRAVIPFYYPLMQEPNLNSPFAGNKWEAQASIGWRFHKDPKKEDVNDDTDGKVRKNI